MAQQIPPLPGILDVAVHGDAASVAVMMPDGSWVHMGHRALARWLKSKGHRPGQPIRLISCATGAKTRGLAQHLANSLGSPIIAPTKTLYGDLAGNLWIGTKRSPGRWRTFAPKKVRGRSWWQEMMGRKPPSQQSGTFGPRGGRWPWQRRAPDDQSFAPTPHRKGALLPEEITHAERGDFTATGLHQSGGHGRSNIGALRREGYKELKPAEVRARRSAEQPFLDALAHWERLRDARRAWRERHQAEMRALEIPRIEGQLQARGLTEAAFHQLQLELVDAYTRLHVWEQANPAPQAPGPRPQMGDFGLPPGYQLLQDSRYFYREKLGDSGATIGGIHPTRNPIHFDGHTWMPRTWEAAPIADLLISSRTPGVTREVGPSMFKYTAWVKKGPDGSYSVAPPGTPNPGQSGYVKMGVIVPRDGAGRTVFPEMRQQ